MTYWYVIWCHMDRAWVVVDKAGNRIHWFQDRYDALAHAEALNAIAEGKRRKSK